MLFSLNDLINMDYIKIIFNLINSQKKCDANFKTPAISFVQLVITDAIIYASKSKADTILAFNYLQTPQYVLNFKCCLFKASCNITEAFTYDNSAEYKVTKRN